MKRMIRTLVCLLLCACLLLAGMPEVKALDEIRAVKKIISVVYDDSGSMQLENRDTYTNYATQALSALLNEQDELYITRMSNVLKNASTAAEQMDLNDISGTVQRIRAMGAGSDTPAASMDVAFERLSASSETDPTTQFWLVVMTDGEFQGLGGTDLRTKLLNYTGMTMSNGTNPNVVYLSMGSGKTLDDDPSIGFYTFRAKDSKEISAVLKNIAALVSGRITVAKLKMKDDRTLTFNADLPLYSVSILSQNSDASVASAETAGGKLDVSRNIALESKRGTVSIFGNAAVLINRSGGTRDVIPAGSITVHFSSPVEQDQITVQYEPAIDLKAVVSRGGQIIDDPSALSPDDKIDITLTPVIPGTDTEIPFGDLPAGITWTVSYEQGGAVIASEDGRTLKGVTLAEGDSLVRGTMQIPGFAALRYEITLKLENKLKNFGILVEQPDPLEYPRAELGAKNKLITGHHEEGDIVFRLTANGEVLDAETIKKAGLHLQIDEIICDDSRIERAQNLLSRITVDCRLKQEDDGSITLIPGNTVPFSVCFIRAGDYTVKVSLAEDSSVTATAHFTVVPKLSDWINLAVLLGIVVLLSMFIITLFKPHFPNATIYCDPIKIDAKGKGMLKKGQTESMSIGWGTGYAVLFRVPVCFNDTKLKLIPCRKGIVRIEGSSISKELEKYGTGQSMDFATQAKDILEGLAPTKDESGKKIKIGDQTIPYSSEDPLYIVKEGEKDLRRMYLGE